MNLNKHLEFFDPSIITDSIHIIGVGAIGSTLAELLTRLGCEALHLYDFDTVSEHNITNQMYRAVDIGRSKVDAIDNILKGINPDIQLTLHSKGYLSNMPLSGYVFLCVDSIELRQAITNKQLYNKNIKLMCDYRMRLTDAQHYMADWNNDAEIKKFLASMAFTAEEAKASTPVSACGTSLSVTPTVRNIVSFGVANFMNFAMKKTHKTFIMLDSFSMNLITFPE